MRLRKKGSQLVYVNKFHQSSNRISKRPFIFQFKNKKRKTNFMSLKDHSFSKMKIKTKNKIKVTANIFLDQKFFCFLLKWDSLHARLKSHYKAFWRWTNGSREPASEGPTVMHIHFCSLSKNVRGKWNIDFHKHCVIMTQRTWAPPPHPPPTPCYMRHSQIFDKINNFPKKILNVFRGKRQIHIWRTV